MKHRCPNCGEIENLHTNDLVTRINTGCYWECRACGCPINDDGTENDVLFWRAEWCRDGDEAARPEPEYMREDAVR